MSEAVAEVINYFVYCGVTGIWTKLVVALVVVAKSLSDHREHLEPMVSVLLAQGQGHYVMLKF